MSNFNLAELSLLKPEIFLACASMLFLVAGVLRRDEKAEGLVAILSLIALAVTGWLVLATPVSAVPVLGGMVIADSFAVLMKLLIVAGLAAAIALAMGQNKGKRMGCFEYPLLVLFAGLGMMLMVSAGNLLGVYVGLEMQSLALYVLAAIRRDDARSSEAGVKYFVLGALASGMLLFGMSLVYGFTGSLEFGKIATAIGPIPSMGVIVGMVFILAGVAFKISAVPFHMWTPDVYEGAPTPVTALFAIVPKLAGMALLIRLVTGPFGGMTEDWQQILCFLAGASMIWASFAALAQTNIKRLMAYSSIGNMGYALMGVAAGSAGGMGGVILYMAIYMVMSAGVFGIILMMRRGGQPLEQIADLAGLSRTRPLAAYALAILLFSMAGIPPMAGFFGKMFVFQAAVASGLVTLAVIGVLTSVIAAYYYIRLIKIMFFDEPVPAWDKEPLSTPALVAGIAVAFILLFILAPGAVLEAGIAAAQPLFVQ